MKNIICCVLILLMVLSLLVGCSQKEKILLDADTVRVTRTGNLTSVCDLVGNKTYTFRSVRKPRTAATETASRVVHTDSIIITVLSDGGFHIVSGGKEYFINKRGVFA